MLRWGLVRTNWRLAIGCLWAVGACAGGRRSAGARRWPRPRQNGKAGRPLSRVLLRREKGQRSTPPAAVTTGRNGTTTAAGGRVPAARKPVVVRMPGPYVEARPGLNGFAGDG